MSTTAAKDTPRVIVIGASSGGLDAIRAIAASLPADFPVPICVVLHLAPHSPRVLDAIISRAGVLPALMPADLAPLQAGHIYVAPPDYHLLVEPGRLRITRGPRENRFRPAIDPLFRSAAQVYGPAAIGVILSGDLDDGSAGLWAVKQLGGISIIQDPRDAAYSSMPWSALSRVEVDYRLLLKEIGPLLVQLASTSIAKRERIVVPDHLQVDIDIAKEQHPMDAGLGRVTEPSVYACPECHGVLQQLKEAGVLRFRCHTGHAYAPESLLAELRERVDESLWASIRSLEEFGLLLCHLAAHEGSTAPAANGETLIREAEATRAAADALRQITSKMVPTWPPNVPSGAPAAIGSGSASSD